MGFHGESERPSANGMQCCPNCDSLLVQPGNWHELGDGNWNVELRCPECRWRDRHSYSQDEVDRYEVELGRSDQELIEDLRVISRVNMEEEANRFAAALAADSILPEDFDDGRGLA